MKLWLLLVLVFLIQEPISTGAVLLNAYQLHYNVWAIHALFCAATLLDVVIGYYLGRFIDKKFAQNRAVAWIHAKFKKFDAFVGESGKAVVLIVYAPAVFPFSGIFIPWLDTSLTESVIFILIGEIIFWYLPEWLLILGVKTFVTNPLTGIIVIIAVTALLMAVPSYFSKRRSRKS